MVKTYHPPLVPSVQNRCCFSINLSADSDDANSRQMSRSWCECKESVVSPLTIVLGFEDTVVVDLVANLGRKVEKADSRIDIQLL
jgi:hypothetical protein